MKRITRFPHKQVRGISIKVIQLNDIFTFHGAVILEILADEDDD